MLEGNRQVSVSIRVRPKLENTVNELHRTERYEKMALTATSDTTLRLWDGKMTKESRHCDFSFDNIFTADTPQADMYETAAVDIVDAVLLGTNASILTYGQTGSGKTYTVLGGIKNNPLSSEIVTEDTGVLMRAIEEMLQHAEQMRARKKRQIILGISVVEIYLDEVRDLLNPASTQGTAINAVTVKDVVRLPNLTYAPLDTLSDALDVYKRATARRVQRATAANDTSSRSHAIFCIELFQMPFHAASAARMTLKECLQARDAYVNATLDPQQRAVKVLRCAEFDGAANPLVGTETCPIMCSKLTVADLAGSEKAKHSDVHGEGFDELRKINASLTALGNVVHSLFEGAKHIPYRDSKLTMVLRDTFAAPGARVSLIVNVSPTVLTFAETLSSLYFADKVKAMRVSRSDGAPDVKLEEAYLKALRVHDALVADLHICACENEKEGRDMSFLPRAAALLGASNPLLRVEGHTAVPAGQAKAAAIAALCAHLREEASHRSADERLQRFLKEQRKSLLEEMFADYLAQRAAVKKELKEVVSSIQRTEEEEKAREDGMREVLTAEHQAYTAVHKNRQALDKAKKQAVADARSLSGAEAETSVLMQQLEKSFEKDPALHRSSSLVAKAASEVAKQDDEWQRQSARGLAAVDAARLREELADLWAENECLAHGRIRAPQDVHAWVRGAVLNMAGNAVVQSRKQRSRSQQLHKQSSEGIGFLGSVDANRLPRYWTQKRHVEEEQRKNPLRHSSFDDPALETTISAFMDMGGRARRVLKDGSTRPLLFYVVERHGRKRFCWDEISPDQQQGLRLGALGYVELDTVARILLGQSTPAFAKCKAAGSVFSSFSLEYKSSAAGSVKYVDVVCDTVSEMETWVIGLSKATGLRPRYGQPATVRDGSSNSSSSAPGSPGDAAPSAFSETELELLRAWHIPASTLAEAKAQIEARRMKRSSQRMRITPGELASVTGLDIFRGSAMWAHLHREGLVENPARKLYCYVESPEPDRCRSSTGTATTATTASAESQAPEERADGQATHAVTKKIVS